MKRQYGLDILRVILMLMIFCFHSDAAQVKYGVLNTFLNHGAVALEGFFILSGYCLAKRYRDINVNNWNEIKKFYTKRVLRLLPIFWIVWIVLTIQSFDGVNFFRISRGAFELAGLNSSFDGSFFVGNGDWFVSCILFCYFVFPFLMSIIRQLDNKSKLILIALLYIISSIAPFIAAHFAYSWTYPNPFYRMLQFAVGIIVAEYAMDYKVKNRWAIIIAGITFALLGVSVTYLSSWGMDNITYGCYEVVTMITWPIIVFFLGELQVKNVNGLIWKIIMHLGSVSYGFYLMQKFCFKATGWIIEKGESGNWLNNTNLSRLLISFIVCYAGAVILTYLDNRFNGIVKEKMESK